jgi:hypothetical protein
MNSLTNFKLLILLAFWCFNAGAQEASVNSQKAKTLSTQEIELIAKDGRSPVKFNGNTYTIAPDEKNNCVLENGKVMSCFSEPDLPYATKIFSVKTPGTDKEHLVVWFSMGDSRFFGHSVGL